MLGRWKTAVETFLLLSFLVLGLVFFHPGLLLLSMLLGVHLTVGLALADDERQPRLRAQRSVFAVRLYEGEEVEIEVEVENRGPGLEVVVVDDGPPADLALVAGEAVAVRTLPPQEKISLRYTVHPRRGLYQLGSVHGEVRDLLGFVLWRGDIPCPATFSVLPRYERLTRITAATRRTLIAPGTVRSGKSGSGIEFFGTRDYLPGDAPRRINWKALARSDRLVINEFEEERATEVAMILDVREAAYRIQKGDDLFDHAVRATAAVAHFFLREDHRVGLLMYGRYLDWIFPGYGHRHEERILQALARAKLGQAEIFSELRYLPTRLLPTGSQLVFVSPLLPGDEDILGTLQARGYGVLALIPDPIVQELAGMRDTAEVRLAAQILELERWVMLRRLLSQGVQSLVWDVRYPLTPQAKAAFGRRR